MKLRSRYTSTLSVTMLALGLAVGIIAPDLTVTSTPAVAASPANTSFPDTAVGRDGFAAILRQASS